MNTLGEKIKQLRIDNNLTQQDLAMRLYVSDKTVSSWEVNRTIPDVNMLFKLSSILNVSIYKLLENSYCNEIPLEIEVKLKVDKEEYKRLFEKIKKQNLEEKIVKQVDTYYYLPTFKERKEFLRIRNEDGKYILGYKRQSENNIRDEFETMIDNVENMEKILVALGLKKKGVIAKKRIKFLYQNKYEIAFDEVDNIGLFIEIEVKKIEFSNEEELNKLRDLLKSFNVDLGLIESKKYSDYLED